MRESVTIINEVGEFQAVGRPYYCDRGCYMLIPVHQTNPDYIPLSLRLILSAYYFDLETLKSELNFFVTQDISFGRMSAENIFSNIDTLVTDKCIIQLFAFLSPIDGLCRINVYPTVFPTGEEEFNIDEADRFPRWYSNSIVAIAEVDHWIRKRNLTVVQNWKPVKELKPVVLNAATKP